MEWDTIFTVLMAICLLVGIFLFGFFCAENRLYKNLLKDCRNEQFVAPMGR